MTIIENKPQPPTSSTQGTPDSHIQIFQNPQPDQYLLDEFAMNTPESLKPTLELIREKHLHTYNPVQFRFIESMADKALQYHTPVAEIITKKVRQALVNYLNDFSSQKKTKESVNHSNTINSELAQLTKDMFQNNNYETAESQQTFEDEFRLQEKEIMHSVAKVTKNMAIKGHNEPNQLKVENQSFTPHNDLSIMHQFRQSKVKHHSEQQLTRTINEGPEDAGPLNSQALIIRSLKTMEKLSPSYINRFISYMDTLLWLEQAGKEGTKNKSKKK